MRNHYIVRLKDNRLHCFYQLKERGIFYKIYEKNKWSKEKLLIERGRENFTVSSDKKDIYLFCQDAEGNMILSKGRDDEWESRVILQNQSDKVHVVLFNPILVENGLCLIYNVPSANVSPMEEKGQYLVRQHVVDGKWSQAARIDKFTSMDLYQLQYITREHCVLFYQSGTGENNLGYREITPKHIGDYHIFHTAPYMVADASFLATNSAVHVLYIVRGMFASQLIYKKKDGNHFSAPQVLFEGQRFENCLLSIIKDNIYAIFLSGGRLMYCVSYDKGASFSRPAQYRNKICADPVKAVYRSELPQHEHHFFCREVYVDQNNPWDIQMLPELYEDFYPTEEAVESRKDVRAEEDAGTRRAPVGEEEYLRLRGQLMLGQKQLQEKDRQIIQLTALLKDKNEELNRLLNFSINPANDQMDGGTALGQ